MIIVVPDEDLYEQGIWPSMFNSDHKATFRKSNDHSWFPVSYDLEQLLRRLPRVEILSIDVQDEGYDYSKKRRGLTSLGRAVWRFRRGTIVRRIRTRFTHVDKYFNWVDGSFNWLEDSLGVPIDQTLGHALAQIQAVVRKQHDSDRESLVAQTLADA
jgi:hypothetical protein